MPLGIVTRIDLLALYDVPEDVGSTVAAIMHSPVTIHTQATLGDAANVMAQMAAPTSVWNI
jgi:CBS domain-containing protein